MVQWTHVANLLISAHSNAVPATVAFRTKKKLCQKFNDMTINTRVEVNQQFLATMIPAKPVAQRSFDAENLGQGLHTCALLFGPFADSLTLSLNSSFQDSFVEILSRATVL